MKANEQVCRLCSGSGMMHCSNVETKDDEDGNPIVVHRIRFTTKCLLCNGMGVKVRRGSDGWIWPDL